MGYAFGYEIGVTESLCALLEVDYSNFPIHDPHFSEGGRLVVLGGNATSFLVTANAKVKWWKGGHWVEPYALGGLGMSRFTHRSITRVDIFSGYADFFEGSAVTKPAARLGMGIWVNGPERSRLGAYLDYNLASVLDDPAVFYGFFRMGLGLNL